MRKLRLLFLTLLAAPLLVTASASAWSPFGGLDNSCQQATQQAQKQHQQPPAVCQDRAANANPLIGPNGLLIEITNFIAVIAGVAAVIIIIIAGLRLITSGGSSEAVVGARRTIIYVIAGIIIIVLARSLIALVLSKL